MKTLNEHYKLNVDCLKKINQENFNDVCTFIEEKFGPMYQDNKYQLKNILIQNRPQIIYIIKEDLICICLSKISEKAPENYYFELAHECVHLLSPHKDDRFYNKTSNFYGTTVLEEGLASYSSLEYLKYKKVKNKTYEKTLNNFKKHKNYYSAYMLVLELF